MLSKRKIRPELLEHAPLEEARANLAQIVRLNQRFGGHSVLRNILRRAVDGNEAFTLLDVGSASGDTAKMVREWYPKAKVTSLDLSSVNLADAPEPKLLADAFQLPIRENSFDYVYCSLFLHHFEAAAISELMASFYRVSRKAFLVSDLERNILPFLFFPLTRPIFGWTYITMHDGMHSIRSAFRQSELREMANEAGLAHAEIRLHRPAFRISVVARKQNG